jgi:toxin ParE1/3/4
LAPEVGFRFVNLVNIYLLRIAEYPTTFAERYKSVRCKPMKRFPYLITFTIDETAQAINILRVFNTFQEPPDDEA